MPEVFQRGLLDNEKKEVQGYAIYAKKREKEDGFAPIPTQYPVDKEIARRAATEAVRTLNLK